MLKSNKLIHDLKRWIIKQWIQLNSKSIMYDWFWNILCSLKMKEEMNFNIEREIKLVSEKLNMILSNPKKFQNHVNEMNLWNNINTNLSIEIINSFYYQNKWLIS